MRKLILRLGCSFICLALFMSATPGMAWAEACTPAPTQEIAGETAAPTPTEAIAGETATVAPTQEIAGETAAPTPTEAIAGETATVAPTQEIAGEIAAPTPTEAVGGETATVAPTQEIAGEIAAPTPTEAVGGETATVAPTQETVGETATPVPAEKARLQTGVGVTGVSIDRDLLTLRVGGEALLMAVVEPMDADDKTVLWRSSDESVVTVANGLLKAVGTGTAQIVATTQDGGFTANRQVNVWAAVEEIQPDVSKLSLGVGEKHALICTYLPADATPELTYSSNNVRVAKVSKSGIVSARSVGRAVITITDTNGATAQVSVRVWKAPRSVLLSAARKTIGVGETLPLEIGFSKGYGGGYQLYSGDESVAVIDGNTVVGIAPGKAKITVQTYNGKTKTGTLTVAPAPESVTLDRTAVTIGVGDTAQLSAALNAGSAGACAFASRDEDVATVDAARGKVIAKGIGTTEIVVRTYNGCEAVCEVTVVPAPTGIQLQADHLKIGVGEKMALSWSADADSACSVSFSSSNTRYVTVNGAGVVKGKRVGSAVITVRTHNGLTAKIKITVRKAPRSVSLSAARKTIGVGETQPLEIGFSKGYGGGYQLYSGDESVAVIDGNTVVGIAPGKAKITVQTYNGKTKTGTLTVAPAPESVTLDRTAVTIGVGDTAQLSAALNAGSAGACAFASRDEDVATVDAARGKVIAKGIGTTEIVVRTYNGCEAVCEVTVVPAPTSIQLLLPEGSTSLGLGERLELQTILSPSNSAGSVTYKSSNTRYVTVNRYGVVTGKRTGTAVIYATAHNGRRTKLTIHVKKAPTSVSVTLDRTLLGVGEETGYRTRRSSGSAGQIILTSSDENIARVEDGHVIAVAAGSVDIIVTAFNGKYRRVALTVMSAPVSVAIAPTTAVIGVGDHISMSATLSAGSAGAYVFASSNASVITVDAESGVVHAVAEGEATVSVTAYNGVTAQAAIRVVSAPQALSLTAPVKNTADEYVLDLEKRDTFQIVPDLDGRTRLSVSYNSSNSSIATVSASGLVTAKKSGDCTITVATYNGVAVRIRVRVVMWVDRLGSHFVQHAMGGIDGKTYTNSLEAFLANYDKGCRVFECDIAWTRDGELVLWHSWGNNQINAETPLGYVPTLSEFMNMKIDGKYTPLSYRDLTRLMKEYPDAQFLLDSKVRTPEAATTLFRAVYQIAEEEEAVETLDQSIVSVYSKSIYRAIDAVYHYDRYVYASYLIEGKPSAKQFDQITKFCRENGIDMIDIAERWWTPDYISTARKNDLAIEVHTVDSAANAKKYLRGGAKWILTNFLMASDR